MEQMNLFGNIDVPIKSQTKPSFNAEEYQHIVLKSSVSKDEYTDYIHQAFDLETSDVSKVCIPNNLHIDKLGDWNIGVICGASGSGKSTILKHLAHKLGGGNFPPFL